MIDYGPYPGATDLSNVYIFNNVFRTVTMINSVAPRYIRMYDTAGVGPTSLNNIKIMNNLFLDNTITASVTIFYSSTTDPTCSGNEMKNNIFYSGDSSQGFWWVGNTHWTHNPCFTFSNNVYYSPQVRSVAYLETIYTITDWMAANEAGASTAQPSFVRYSPYDAFNDFHLLPSDIAAQNKGIDLSSSCSIISELCKDKDSVTRPQGPAWDIGAYEYVPGGDTTSPAAPSSLAVK